ncbi:S24 family peptidase [Pseudomonas syringae]|nr:S24 family peptidase [Pseudomonas syringae]
MSITILGPISAGGEKLPLYSFQAFAGLPSLAADHIEKHISPDELFDIPTPDLYMVKIEEDSMQGVGIFSGDLLIVDRSLYAEHGDIVIAALNAEPVCKRLHMRENTCMLTSENSKYPPQHVMECDDLVIWGGVKHSVRVHGKL